jgi:bacillithiol synthase
MADLYTDYTAGKDTLAPFYEKPLPSLFTAPPDARPWAEGLHEALQHFQNALSIQRAFTGTEAIVATGQQPGLFTGPLYTIYKAVTAIRLASQIADRTQTPCLPLFWVGADDHDFEEVRTAHILSRNGDDLPLQYHPEADVAGLPMHRMPLEASLHKLIDLAAEAAPGSEYSAEIDALLHSTLESSLSFGEWFARIMAALFRDTPLTLFSPQIPEARRAAVPLIEYAIRNPLACTRLLNEAGRALEALGYTAQIVKGDSECAFFLEYEGRRRKVLFDQSAFHLPEEDTHFSQNDLIEILHESPGRFSPNVALRCVIQQALFPVAAYVAGPGEVAYWAQLKPVFSHFGLPMPAVYPRAQAMITTTKITKLMNRFGFSPDDLLDPPDRLEDRALKKALRNPALEALAQQRPDINAAFDRLIQRLEQVSKKDRQAPDMARALSGQLQNGLDRIERSLLFADKEQTEALRKQLRRLCNTLAPQRRPQERHYCAFSFLFEQGWEFIPRLLENIDIESFTINKVEL